MADMQDVSEERPLRVSGVKRALDRVSERGAFGWIRLIVLLVCGISAGIYMGSQAPSIMSMLFRVFQLSDAAPSDKDMLHGSRSPVSTTGLVLTGMFLGTFLGALVLNTISRVGNRWEKMPGGEKLNIFIGVFFGFIGALP